MKQLFQSLKNGQLYLEDIPNRKPDSNNICIKTSISLLSPGTEKMLLDFGKSGILKKALTQPERVKEVINKMKIEGVFETYQKVLNKLDQPIPLGYCNVGIVESVGKDVKNYKVGDRVVSNGFHAEFVEVPENLCQKIPDNVTDEQAVFTILSSISLHGIRLSEPTLGETYVVIGMGLVGLLCTELLILNGCNVISVDIDSSRLEHAKNLGAETVHLSEKMSIDDAVSAISGKHLVDAVIISTSSQSSDPVDIAAKVCRKKGRIILVGTADIRFSRQDLYEKEISFKVSSSYGPGRYDKNYEDKSIDYPIAYVRWTQNRNFESILNLIDKGSFKPDKLITDRFNFENFEQGYEALNKNNSLGIIFQYNLESSVQRDTLVLNNKTSAPKDSMKVDFIGAGNYATSVLMPKLEKNNVDFNMLLTKSGLNTPNVLKKYSFNGVTSNADEIFKNGNSDIVFVASSHSSHAKFLIQAIDADKNIFLEKPLCINFEQLNEIKNKINNSPQLPSIMMGFNRRFSPLVQKIKNVLSTNKYPLAIEYTINAGNISNDHWIQDKEEGGGRLIGEACHFIDLAVFLSDSDIDDYSVMHSDALNRDTFSISVKFKNSSIANINYFSNGNSKYPKEILKVFFNDKVIVLDNFKKLKSYGVKSLKNISYFSQKKGQAECIKGFIETIKKGERSPIKLQEILKVSEISLELSHN